MQQEPARVESTAEERIQAYLRTTGLSARHPRVIPLTGDASDRRYFRVMLSGADPVVLALHAGPIQFTAMPFANVAELLGRMHLPVPSILGHDDALGVIALEDLGDVTLQAHVGVASVTEHAGLYREAVSLIHQLQTRGRDHAGAGYVPYTLAFDIEKLTWELEFFRTHFLEGYKGAVLSLIADPNGDGFISGGDDGRLLRLAPDGSIAELAHQKGKWIDKLVAHRATGAIAASVGKMALVIDKAGASREFGPNQSTVAAVDFSKDGGRIACAHYGGITVWSIGNVTQPPRRFAWAGSHVALRWSTDGKFIATGTQENDIHVWRIAQATDMRMQGYPAKVKSLTWSADARWLYTSSQPVFTAWSFAGKGPEGKPPLQFGDEGAGQIGRAHV